MADARRGAKRRRPLRDPRSSDYSVAMHRAFVTGGSGFLGSRLIEILVERGVAVVALARSPRAEEAVRRAGAETVVHGDLDDAAALEHGMRGCDVAFHSAAKVEEWGEPEDFERINVQGTARTLRAARVAGVSRFVHVSTEAVLAGRSAPIVQADETWPYPSDFVGEYPRTKALAEERVRAAAREGLHATIARPRFIWGKGDTTLLPSLIERIRRKQFAWIAGGRFLTSTCHVDNVVEGMILCAERGRAGEAYFLTDGSPVEFRTFVGDMLRTQGVEPPSRELPRAVAWALAASTEATWRTLRLGGTPPVTRTAVRLGGDEVTVRDDKARRELGYVGRKTIQRGLDELRASAQA